MENIKLSFIVPVYNVEKYMRKCVDSLLAQDLPSSAYEIILVDDGSPDGCPQICDDYAAAHDNIRVSHQKNGGLSAARNAGLTVAKGEYVCFVDSDDYWEENLLGGLMEQIERENLDVLRFKYQNVNERYEVFNPYKSDPYRNDDYSDEVTDGTTFLNMRFGTACYAVMFIVRREMFDGCIFTEGIYFEDTDWTPRMLTKAKRIASTNTIVYNYLIRQGSITKAVRQSKKKKVLNDKIRLLGELQRQANELQKRGQSIAWYGGMIAATVISIVGIISTDFYKERKGLLKQLKALDVYPIKYKSLKARLINLSPRLAVELLHVKHATRGMHNVNI